MPKRQYTPRGPSEVKYYGGKPYYLGQGWPTKAKAVKAASERRKQGYLVRITKYPFGYYLYEGRR